MTSPAADLSTRARQALRQLVGRDDVDFRDGQLEAITALVRDRQRALVVQRTGWGKSAVYFVATSLIRADGGGPTVIVSPLLALMRDQIAAAQRAGIRAVSMNSANAQDWGTVRDQLLSNSVDLLLVSPERLNNPRFRSEQLPDLAERCGLLVVDEAHCISDWGHDFRPDYRRIRDLLTDLPDQTPVLATTATANERVVADVQEQLGAGGHEVTITRGGLARDSLRLGVLPAATPEQRLGWLVAHLDSLPGSGIIYALTVAGAEDVAAALRAQGHVVESYTGRTDPQDREVLERRLRDNDVKALVATSALGMGFDKPDLGFVVHLGAPSSPVAYYQQVGRAGRATDRADVLLLPGAEDKDIWSYFASASMPRRDQADAVISALDAAGGTMSTAALETAVDIRRTRLELLLKVLDVDGAVRRVTGGWESTGAGWTYDAQRYARVADAREREQQLMLDYENTTECRMRFLQVALDDPSATDCGRCDRCTSPWYPDQVDDASLSTARRSLSGVGVPIEPRTMWPTGMDRLGVPVKGKIGPDQRLEPGRAIARLTDLGWGTRLRALLEGPDAPPPEWLGEAAVNVLRTWGWQTRPTGVVAMTSAGHPDLVVGLARGLAQVGRLTYVGDLSLQANSRSDPAAEAAGAHAGRTSGGSGNSAFRLRDVWGLYRLSPLVRATIADLANEAVAVGQQPGPLLLVTDLIDSRWSVTVAGRELRGAGAPGVLPLGIATVG